MKNASEGTHSNKNSLSISGEERAGLTFSLPHHPLEDVQAKKKQTTTQQSSLLQKCAKHLWREPQIIKFENSSHIWINIGYICERTLSAMSRVTLPCVSYRLQFTITTSLLLILSRISQNWFPTASGVLLLVSRIISLNKCNRFRYNI